MIITYFIQYNDLNRFFSNISDEDDDFDYDDNDDDDDFNYDDDYYEWYWNSGDEEDYVTFNGFNNFKKKQKNFYKIMDKFDEDKDDFDLGDDNPKETINKFNILKILPWITFNFNILIQFIMFIFIIILIGRIKRKSDFGFPRNDNNLTSHNRRLGKRKSKNIKYLEQSNYLRKFFKSKNHQWL